MEVPIEILASIVDLLKNTWNFATIRLVNKAFAALGAVHLFRTIQISPTARDVHNVQSIYENFGPYIRKIIISGATRTLNAFDRHSPEFDEMKALMRRDVLRDAPQPFSNLHLRHLAAVHTLVCEERKIALTPNGLERFLRQVIKYAPRIEDVRFSRWPRDRRERSGDGALVKPYKPCSEPRCLEAQERVYDILRLEFSEADLEDINARIRGAIQTISRARVPIKMLGFWGYMQSLSIPRGRIGTFGTLPYLSTLHLTIDVECDGKNRFSAWLATSTQLEKLYVAIQRQPRYSIRSTTTLNEVFATCRFPKLRNLLLEEFDSDSQELLRFLQSCGQLEQLVLLSYNLHNNSVESWHRVLDDIRNATRLEPIKNIEDLADSSFDESRKKPDEWIMDPWDDNNLDQLRFISDCLSRKGRGTMGQIYLWGGHERAKGDAIDDYLLQSHRCYRGSTGTFYN